jgi:hypothetical protein
VHHLYMCVCVHGFSFVSFSRRLKMDSLTLFALRMKSNMETWRMGQVNID